MNVVQHLPAVNSIEADLLRFSLVRIAAGSEHPQRSSRPAAAEVARREVGLRSNMWSSPQLVK